MDSKQKSSPNLLYKCTFKLQMAAPSYVKNNVDICMYSGVLLFY